MQSVGVLFLIAAVWWIYSGIKGYRPVALLMAILRSPDQASQIIADADSYVSAHKADFDTGDESSGPFAGGGSFDGPTQTPDNDPKSYASSKMSAYGWKAGEFEALDKLWTRESNWNPKATNPSSGAYGIPQALPGSKMATAGLDWKTNYKTQIDWGLGYIRGRYGSPSKAWAHEQQVGWY